MFWNGSSPTDPEFLCAKLILKSSTHTHTQCVSGQHPSTYPSGFGEAARECETHRVSTTPDPWFSTLQLYRKNNQQQQRVFLEAPTKRWAIRSFATYPASFSVHQATQSLQWLAVWKWANLGDHTCPGPTDSNHKQPFFISLHPSKPQKKRWNFSSLFSYQVARMANYPNYPPSCWGHRHSHINQLRSLGAYGQSGSLPQ